LTRPRVGGDEAELAGLRRGRGGHAAEILRLVGAAVERFEVRAVGDAGAVEERDVRVLRGELLERVGIAKGAADDDIIALADRPAGVGGRVLGTFSTQDGDPIDFSCAGRR
jgi:hypothetical protein